MDSSIKSKYYKYLYDIFRNNLYLKHLYLFFIRPYLNCSTRDLQYVRAQCKTRSFSTHKMRVELNFVFMSYFYHFV